jgi:hypothetical protein
MERSSSMAVNMTSLSKDLFMAYVSSMLSYRRGGSMGHWAGMCLMSSMKVT